MHRKVWRELLLVVASVRSREINLAHFNQASTIALTNQQDSKEDAIRDLKRLTVCACMVFCSLTMMLCCGERIMQACGTNDNKPVRYNYMCERW